MAVALDQGKAGYDGKGHGNAERCQCGDALQRVRLQPGNGKIDHVTCLLT
jgi:hypothetical protein